MTSKITEKLKDPHINDDVNHLYDALRYALHTAYIPRVELKIYECNCSKCGFKYYTSIKQCNCPRCGCDGEHFRCSELK